MLLKKGGAARSDTLLMIFLGLLSGRKTGSGNERWWVFPLFLLLFFFFLFRCQLSSDPLHISDEFCAALIKHRTVFCLAMSAQLGPIMAAAALMSHPPCHNPSSSLWGDIYQPGLALKAGKKAIRGKKNRKEKQKCVFRLNRLDCYWCDSHGCYQW